jgi:hypothetical protein
MYHARLICVSPNVENTQEIFSQNRNNNGTYVPLFPVNYVILSSSVKLGLLKMERRFVGAD